MCHGDPLPLCSGDTDGVCIVQPGLRKLPTVHNSLHESWERPKPSGDGKPGQKGVAHYGLPTKQ